MKGGYELYGNEANVVPVSGFLRNLGLMDPGLNRVAEDRVHKIIFETVVNKVILSSK